MVYALPDEQHCVAVPFRPGLSAREAFRLSGLGTRFPEIGGHALVVGIFGRRVDPDEPVAAGDRVEICRPLQADPRAMRKARVAAGSTMGKGAGVS